MTENICYEQTVGRLNFRANTEHGRNAKTCSAVQKSGDAPHILRGKCELDAAIC